MKIEIIDNGSIRIGCLDDLNKLIHRSKDGRPENYGQGEGQFMVEGTIWGVYQCSSGGHYITFEEGSGDWQDIQSIVESIFDAVRESFGSSIRFRIVGALSSTAGSFR